MARIDILDSVRVASPCPMKWEEMYGDERRRFCEPCERSVYDISSMSSEEARCFLLQHEGRVCVAFFRRADGRIMTTDCEVGVRHRTMLRSRALTGLGLLGAMIALGLTVFGVSSSLAEAESQKNAPREMLPTRRLGAIGPLRLQDQPRSGDKHGRPGR